VATQDVFSAEELARLRGFPEINRAELIRYFTLAPADEMWSSRHGCGSDRGNDGLRPVRVRISGDTLPECKVRTVEGPSFKVD
jgi:hypothetical protein